MDNSKLKWIYLVILSVIWGSSFILIDQSLKGLSAVQVGSLRIVITSVFLASVGFKKLKLIEKPQWKWIVITALLGSFFPPFLFALAQYELDSAVAAMLNSLTPLNTVIFGILFFSVTVSKQQLLGVLIGFAGAMCLILAGADFNPDQNYWYSIFIIISSVGYGVNVNFIKKYLNDVNALAITVGNFMVIVIPALLILAFTGFFTAVWEDVAMQKALGFVALLALFGTSIAKVVFNRLVQISSPVFASSVTYTLPLVAIFWGIIAGEKFSFFQFLGGAIILIGVYLVNKSKRKKKTKKESKV